MSDPNENAPAAPESTEQGDPEVLGEGGMKALVAEREARAAAESQAKELQAQIDAIEAEKLSDLEKAQKAAEAAQADAEYARAESLRWRIAAKHGIADDDAELFLTGSDEETLTRQAERLAQRQSAAQQVGNVAPTVGSNNQPQAQTGDWLRDQLARN